MAIDGTLDAVEKFAILAREKGQGAEIFELRMAHKDAIREHLACHNPQCFSGGFSMGDLLRDLVRNRQEVFVGTGFCTGEEGDPEDPGPHRSCPTRFDIEATLHFR